MSDFLPSGSRVEVAADMYDSAAFGRIDAAATVQALGQNLGQWGIAIEYSHGSADVFGGKASFDLGLVVNADGQYSIDEVRGAVESELTNIANDNCKTCSVIGVRVVQYQIPSLTPVNTGGAPPSTKITGAPTKKDSSDCGFFSKLPFVGDAKCGGGSGFGFSTGVIVTLGVLIVAGAAAVVYLPRPK